jgi:hypothetical protein
VVVVWAEEVRRDVVPGREAELEARRWPAFRAVFWRTISFSERVSVRGGRAATTVGGGGGGGDVVSAGWIVGDLW